jgi:dissimilatory sulfite reductase (desulfoviridin) alpha/beta subunit
MIRRKVEERVAAAGQTRVTLASVREARRRFLSGDPAAPTPAPEQRGAPRPSPAAPFPLGEDEIRAIERLAEQNSGVDTRYFGVRTCGGAVGCPLTLADVGRLAEEVARRIEATGIADYLAGAIRGPVLTHHKFRGSVAGCPNSCSEPQIKDYGVVAQARPGPGRGECTDCGGCVGACREGAVSVVDGPVFDFERCVSCGRCAAACPTEAIAVARRGYAVLVGGKLGRHPQLAERVLDLASEDEALHALDACLDLYKAEAQGPERLGSVLNRVGLAALLGRLDGRGGI